MGNEKNWNGNYSKNGNRMVMEKDSNSGMVMRIEWKCLGLNGIRMEISLYETWATWRSNQSVTNNFD